MKKIRVFNILSTVLILAFLLSGCQEKSINREGDDDDNNQEISGVFALGADVSWLTEMEAAGRKFYDNNGRETECMTLLKGLGMNAIRLRVWVNPSDGWCNQEDFMVKARRAHKLGMRIMVDFHYSDSWADPSKQYKPAQWEDISLNQLSEALSSHTLEVLHAMQAEKITPEWVQVGNETGDGMLWEEGRASKNMAQYAMLHQSGYVAVKQVFPKTKVIVHLHNGFDNSLYRWLFDGLKKAGATWDIIGMSLYPTASNYSTLVNQCFTNMQDMVQRYNSPVMICEVGMPWDNAAACKSFLTELISKGKSLANNMCLGVFYWEPECYGGWKNYTLGAFDATGKPTIALEAFKQ